MDQLFVSVFLEHYKILDKLIVSAFKLIYY